QPNQLESRALVGLAQPVESRGGRFETLQRAVQLAFRFFDFRQDAPRDCHFVAVAEAMPVARAVSRPLARFAQRSLLERDFRQSALDLENDVAVHRDRARDAQTQEQSSAGALQIAPRETQL